MKMNPGVARCDIALLAEANHCAPVCEVRDANPQVSQGDRVMEVVEEASG